MVYIRGKEGKICYFYIFSVSYYGNSYFSKLFLVCFFVLCLGVFICEI